MSLLPARRNWTAWRGGTFRKVLNLKQGDINSGALDLTGYTARMVIRDAPAGAVLLSLTTENGGIALGGAAGTVTIYISDEDTATLTWNNGFYELFLITPSGDANPYLHGSLRVIGAG
jgi:hypothetical protein